MFIKIFNATRKYYRSGCPQSIELVYRLMTSALSSSPSLIENDKPFVKIVEVGPRDGLQNEPKFVETSVKVKLIDMLSRCGIPAIEATSFVSPKAIPQLKDSLAVMRSINRNSGIKYTALVPNLKGLEIAIQCNMDEVAVFGAASETFSRKNINCTIEESVKRFKEVTDECKRRSIPVRAYVSCIAGCPYEGAVAPERVAQVARSYYELGCYEVSLGDTIGVGFPEQIERVVRAVTDPQLGAVPLERIALHCHDTHSRALANITRAYELGVRVFDASVAGLGGCPYARGATGNVSTESVVRLMHRLGARTGVDLGALNSAGFFIMNYVTPKRPVTDENNR